jgi:Skp family chaperone for outer membrane proteins
MKKRLSIVAAVATCAGLATATTVWAQRPAAPSTVLIDVNKVAESAPRLKQSLEALKKEFEATGETFKKESETANSMVQQLGSLQPHSPKYKQLESKLTKMRADFELRGKRVTEEFKDRESKLYYEHSRELQAELNRFAQRTGILLMLRYEEPEGEIKDPRQAMRVIMNPVVYQRGLDATAAVQRSLGGAAAPTATLPPQTAPAGRPPLQR